MAVLVVAHANVHHTLRVTLLLPDFREGDTHSSCKLRLLSSCRSVHYGQRLSLRRHFSCTRNCRGLSSTMFILPRASFSIESYAQRLPDYWLNITKVFENETAGAAELLSNGIPSHLASVNFAEGFLHNFSALPIELTVVAVATIVGSTLGYLVTSLPTSRNERLQSKGSDHMEPPREKWLLFTKSTPFNRFVMMRCPSIEFESNNARESLSKRLSTEGHHVITLSIDNADSSATNDTNGLGKNTDPNKDGEKSCGSLLQTGLQKEDFTPSYQRHFLHAEDGGVLAVDWPSHLELSGEHGLDTTLLIISGSVDGSRDEHIQELVKRSVKCGYFPIVLNPRGCGGSLLTTPRLFTAGDSDDVRTAVQFVLKSRSWATIMAVGWGYGSNMLVKYLGEETLTPVTGAVCVDSIFNIEELNCHNTCFQQKITSGLVQILKSNQMVFQGKREFDVQKGLLATSLREFDESISMVSKGYHDVQEFYKDSSSNSWINNVKIPVFCIQVTQGFEHGIESIGKTTSIGPRVSEENPFTTLIFQLTRNGKLSFQTSKTEAYDSLMIEWLAAVEMAFLKGRHPLLQGLDVTYQPQAKGRPALQQPPQPQSSPNGGELRMGNKIPLTGMRRVDSFSNYVPSVNYREGDLKDWKREDRIEMNGPPQKSKALVNTAKDMYKVDEEKSSREGDSEKGQGSHESNNEEKSSKEGDSERGKGLHESSDDESGDDESDGDESEVEQGQVQQAAESIMKVLDVTMPGTLSKKQKEEVLEAVGRGESIVTALQEACPEDVREKMTTAVSAAVQARGISLKLAGFGKSMPAPKIPDGMVDSIQEKLSSMVQNKVPAVFANDTDKSADKSNDIAGQKQQNTMSGQNEGQKPSVQESSDSQQPESMPSALHAGQNGNGAAMEQVHKAGSGGEEQVTTHGQDRETDTHNGSSLESKASGQEKGDSKGKPDSTDSRTSQGDIIQAERQGAPLPQEDHNREGQDQKQESGGAASQTTDTPQNEKKQEKGDKIAKPASKDGTTNQGDTVHAEKQADPSPHEDQKHEGQDQKQESVGAAPQTTETPQVEKKNDSNTSSEDLSKKSPDPNPGEVTSPQAQAPAAPQMQAPDVPQTQAPPAPQTQTPDAPQTQAPDVPQTQAPDAPPTQAPAAPSLPSIDVGRAFEALTGVDDSTQMAVSNVFGVIENVIDKLEKDQGQKEEQFEQPSLPKHQSSASQTSHSESVPGTTTQNQSSHVTPSRDDSGHQRIPKTGNDESRKQELDKNSIQTSPNREVDKTSEKTKMGTANNCPAESPPATTELETDSTLDMGQDLEDGDLALEYCEDENVWKFLDGMSNSRVVSGTQDNSRAKKLDERSHTGNTNLKRLSDMERSQVIIPEHLIEDNELQDSEIQTFLPVETSDNMHSAFASENSVSNGRGSTSLCTSKKMQELVIDALQIELLRRSGGSILDTALQQDIEKVGFAVAEKAELSMQLRRPAFTDKSSLKKTSESTPVEMTGRAEKMHVETVISAINEAYGNTVMLSNLLPPGVLFGIVLAALSPLDIISTDDAQDSRELVHIQGGDSGLRSNLSLAQRHQKTGFADSEFTKSDRPEKPYMIEQSHGFTKNGASSERDSGRKEEVDPYVMEQSHGFTQNGASSEQDSGQKEDVDPYMMEQSHGLTENGASSQQDSGPKERVDRGLSLKDVKIPGDVDTHKSDTVGDGSAEKASSTGNNMMGAVAAAMGASAALASQTQSSEIISNPSKHEQQKANPQASPSNVGTFGSENGGDKFDIDGSNSSIVSTLAEKALSVAAPVVPTKEDGGVDHERLVEILAGLGQKGGILRFIGKIALLWGGLRGAMSLTDRLLGFLHMSDRPLYQRILGFMVMAVLLWSPVLVPLIPALLQQWASQSHNGVASTAALIGLYGAVVILITIWGRKIRGYEDPLQQYGVSIEPAFNAKQVLSLMGGLTMGLSLVASIYLLGVTFHMIQIDWAPALFSNSSNTYLWNIVSSWKVFKILVQCFGISLAVSFVEELFFRSWLQEEISTDFGFHRAAALSGLAFSISHWSLPIMPALWLLSLVLAGAKVRCKGDLSLVIGIHAGMMAGTQLMGIGGQVTYGENASLWFVAPQSGDPFTGAIGLSILVVLALLSYPWGYREDDRY